MQPVRFLLPLAVVVTTALPAAAQEDQLFRRSIPYFDHTLTVEVATPAAGTLRLLRAGRSTIEVAARAPNGIAGVGIGGLTGDRLRLDAAGSGRVEYLVVVPENIHVRVQLPRQDWALPAPAEPSSTFTWPGAVDPGFAGSISGTRTGDQLYLLHTAATAPDEVLVQDLAAVRRLAVRTGGDAFELQTSRPLTATPGTSRRIAIQAAGEPLDIVIIVPAGTQNFTLRVPEGVAFAIVNGEAEVNCAPATSQVLGDGRRWVDLTPSGGRLDCRASGRVPAPTPIPAGKRGQPGDR